MYFPLVFGGFLVSFLTTLVLTPVVMRMAYRRAWVDEPDGERKLHVTPVPRVGGMAIVAGFLVGLVYFYTARQLVPESLGRIVLLPPPVVVAAAIAIALVGLWDDLRGMHFLPKLGMQVLVATITVASGTHFLQIGDPFGGGGAVVLPVWLGATLSVMWIVLIINAINLLDGMDGLASGVVVIVFGSLTASYIALGSWTSVVLVVVVVGAAVGFLRYNFNPARIFMGDSGSMFLGYVLAVYCIIGAGKAQSVLAVMIPIIAMGLPLMDTGLAVVRRFLKKQSLFKADRDHIHHRVSRRLQLSHRNTVLFLYAVSVGFGIAGTLLAISGAAFADDIFSVVVLIATGLGIYVLLRKLGYISLVRNPRNNEDPSESTAPHEESGTDSEPDERSLASWSRIEENGEATTARTANSR